MINHAYIYTNFFFVYRYDHLSALLNKILAEKPVNVIEYFEEYSRNLKEERFRTSTDHLQDIYVPPDEFEQAKKLIPLLQVRD